LTGFGVHPPRPVVRRNARVEHWTVAGRLAGVAAVAGLAAVISAANRVPHHPAVHFCCGYTPARLAAGAWWTVLGSALLVVNLHLLGVNTALLLGVVLPFVLREGSRRALTAFFTGHVLATLAVAAVVLPAAAWGWHPAEALRVRVDVGTSAGVAAVGGALAASMIWRRQGEAGKAPERRWGAALLGAFAADFAVRLLLFHTVAEVEHLIALSAGALLGRHWAHSSGRFIAGSWPHPQAE
jgi:hypothetical protein